MSQVLSGSSQWFWDLVREEQEEFDMDRKSAAAAIARRHPKLHEAARAEETATERKALMNSANSLRK